MKKIRDYHDLYLKSMMVADVFEEFGNICIKYHKLGYT